MNAVPYRRVTGWIAHGGPHAPMSGSIATSAAAEPRRLTSLREEFV